MALEIHRLRGEALVRAIPEVAALRISVFREWPYLYDGDLAYEERYLAPYTCADNAVLIGAFDADRLVGASTAMPISAHADDFAEAFSGTPVALSDVFYCAESVLLPQYRGQGAGRAFFAKREAAARDFGFGTSAFCAVIRPADHPERPPDYRPLDPFWLSLGYRPLQGAVASFSWKDTGDSGETKKRLQVWTRDL